VSTRLHRFCDLPDIRRALLRRGEEMKHGAVVPDIVMPGRKRRLRDVRGEPGYQPGGFSNSIAVGEMSRTVMFR
jgi:hypothetical protein